MISCSTDAIERHVTSLVESRSAERSSFGLPELSDESSSPTPTGSQTKPASTFSIGTCFRTRSSEEQEWAALLGMV